MAGEAGYAGVVASFDWPSADSALNYLEDRSDAKQTAIRLVTDCIAPFSVVQSPGCRVNVHVLAHSTGAYVVREAFDDADDRPRIAAANWTASQVVFIGADVSAKSMAAGNAKSSSLYRHCVRLTNYSNPFDAVLKLSNVKRIGVAPRVGRVGLPEGVPDKAVNVDCGRYYAAHEAEMQVLGAKSHSWHIGDPVFTRDLVFTLEGDIDRRAIPTREVGAGGEVFLKS
jgi:esterase/lipase superfamily enzyme